MQRAHIYFCGCGRQLMRSCKRIRMSGKSRFVLSVRHGACTGRDGGWKDNTDRPLAEVIDDFNTRFSKSARISAPEFAEVRPEYVQATSHRLRGHVSLQQLRAALNNLHPLLSLVVNCLRTAPVLDSLVAITEDIMPEPRPLQRHHSDRLAT